MNEQTASLSEGVSVLFFGRNECEGSGKILSQLQRYGFKVTFVASRMRGERLPEEVLEWRGDYILCFRSLFILPGSLLERAEVAAVNFHPAPPEYPGSGCVNFALYDEVEEYGVTAHIMSEQVDAGEILEVRRFPVGKLDDLPTVLTRTHAELRRLCLDFVQSICTVGPSIIDQKRQRSKHERWSGVARRMKELNALQTISLNTTKDELKRIVRATYIEGYPPVIKLHGYNFYLRIED